MQRIRLLNEKKNELRDDNIETNLMNPRFLEPRKNNTPEENPLLNCTFVLKPLNLNLFILFQERKTIEEQHEQKTNRKDHLFKGNANDSVVAGRWGGSLKQASSQI